MEMYDNPQPEIPDSGEEEDIPASRFQLELAASIVARLIERNGGRGAANAFWDDDSFDPEGNAEYVDPEFWDPDEETLPEMNEINWNIHECD